MERAGIQYQQGADDYASNSNFSHIVSKVELDAIRAFPDRKSRFIKQNYNVEDIKLNVRNQITSKYFDSLIVDMTERKSRKPKILVEEPDDDPNF